MREKKDERIAREAKEEEERLEEQDRRRKDDELREEIRVKRRLARIEKTAAKKALQAGLSQQSDGGSSEAHVG